MSAADEPVASETGTTTGPSVVVGSAVAAGAVDPGGSVLSPEPDPSPPRSSVTANTAAATTAAAPSATSSGVRRRRVVGTAAPSWVPVGAPGAAAGGGATGGPNGPANRPAMPLSRACTSWAELGRSSGSLATSAGHQRHELLGRTRRAEAVEAAERPGDVDRLRRRRRHRGGPPAGVAGEQLEHDPPERVQVGPPVDLGQPGRLLRRDVPGRPGHERQRREVEAAGQPEVAEHDRLVGRQPGDVARRRRRSDQHVGRLDVAVEVARRVHVGQRGGDLGGDADRLLRGEHPALGLALADAIVEGAAVGPRHHEVRLAARRLAELEPAHDPRAVDGEEHAGLAEEATADLVVATPVVGEHLDGDLSVEHVVVGQPHGGERPGTEHAQESVRSDVPCVSHRPAI